MLHKAVQIRLYPSSEQEILLAQTYRWFPSSKLCSNCFYQIGEIPLEVRE
jgi:transposase